MQHAIQPDQLASRYGPQANGMLHAIEACVHCGFCLSVCPTYQVLGEEMDSPRGRIFLMKAAMEGSVEVADTLPYIDRCLGCLACVPACPSGVQYGELVVPYKNDAHNRVKSGFMVAAQRSLVQNTLPYPARFKAAAVVGKLAQPLAGMLPHELQGMLRLIPKQLPPARRLPEISPAQGNRRGRVALLAGCVQQVLDQEINWATLRVLNANGVEVVIPQGQVCCGAVLLHSGDTRGALRLAQQNLKAFQGDLHRGDYDAILTNAAGCGSGLKEYKMLFEGRPEQAEVDGFVRRVKDVSVYLAELGLTGTPAWPEPIKVAYHDACHLLHAQGVSSQPRQLLLAVEKVSLAAIPQGEFCCGSAGTYNLTQPELSHELGRRKIEAILSTGCDLVVTGNIGCLVQLKQELRQAGQNLPVMHTFQFLDQAYARRCQV